MWQAEYIVETKADSEKIWALLTDVRNWNEWNAGVEYSYLDGIFRNGTFGSFKTLDGAKALFLSFEIKNCIPNKSFTSRIELLLGYLDIGYELIEEGKNKLKIKHEIKIYGPLTFIHKDKIGKNMATKLSASVKKLKEMAERQ